MEIIIKGLPIWDTSECIVQFPLLIVSSNSRTVNMVACYIDYITSVELTEVVFGILYLFGGKSVLNTSSELYNMLKRYFFTQISMCFCNVYCVSIPIGRWLDFS